MNSTLQQTISPAAKAAWIAELRNPQHRQVCGIERTKTDDGVQMHCALGLLGLAYERSTGDTLFVQSPSHKDEWMIPFEHSGFGRWLGEPQWHDPQTPVGALISRAIEWNDGPAQLGPGGEVPVLGGMQPYLYNINGPALTFAEIATALERSA